MSACCFEVKVFAVKQLNIMGIKPILLSVILAHTCTATFNESSLLDLYDEIFKDLEDIDYNFIGEMGSSDEDVPFFSQEKNRTGFAVVYAPDPRNCTSPKCYHMVQGFWVVDDCNSTLGQIMPNCLSSISNESAVFLKSPLITCFMPSFYILIILISLPLNASALVTFTCKIREKKPAVIYMSHLACEDLLFALLLPLKIHYQFNSSDWVFGEAACRVVTAAYYCYMYCSILLMMSMSVDRMVAVVYPLKSRFWRSTRKASCVCVLVWLLALAGTVPLLSMKQTFTIKNVGVTCHDALYHDDPADQLYMYLFSILSCVFYFLPLVVTLVSYFTIIYVLSVRSDNFASSSSSSFSNNQRRAIFMTITVLTEFVVCFAPTNSILLYHCVCLVTGNKAEGDLSYTAYLVALCLGSASVFLDPLLYYYGSSQCRKKIRSVLRRKNAEISTTPSDTADTRTRLAANCEK